MTQELPPPPAKAAHYEPVIVHGKLAFVSGQVSRLPDGIISGHLQRDDSIEQAKEAAKVSMLRCLSVLKQKLGNLDKIEQVLSVRGFVSAAPDFERHPEVMDAASQCLIQHLGDKGRHTRAALGVASIPGGGLTEIEMVVALV
jgi:enamine deaminase RidA (YjgF/YER057c/UK114 family)